MTDLTPQWSWQYAGADSQVLDRPVSPGFVSRFDAEEWFGLHWRALRDQGAVTAVLVRAGTVVQPRYDLRAVPESMTFAQT